MLSTPKVFIISKATAVDALPEIGLTNIKGSNSEGILIIPRKGESNLSNKSKMPEDLRAFMARNKAIRVGKILTTVLIPSLEPN